VRVLRHDPGFRGKNYCRENGRFRGEIRVSGVETRYPFVMRVFALTLVLFSLTGPVSARPKTHDAAVSVLGQPDLVSESGFNPPTAASLDNADGVAVDPTTGKLFVSDSENHRILRFSASDAYRTSATAEAVFGQADFVSQSANRGQVQPAANSLSNPSSLCCDAQGRLWVCDYNNARVLRFDAASSKASGAAADGVIGQPGFTTRAAATSLVTDSGFENPSGIAVDAAGNLWVADASLPRILRFEAAAALGAAYDGTADGYLGKVDSGEFVVSTGLTADAKGFGLGPGGIGLDAAGRLWASDPTNNRVLRFDDAANKIDGADADGVLGQPDFSTVTYLDPPTAATMSSPYSVTVAPDGTVWVSDFVNHRILGFTGAAALVNGADADIVLGQPDFASNAELPNSARTIKAPSQVAIGREGSLFAAQFRAEGLVKRWSDPVTISAPRSARATKRGTAILRGSSTGAVRVQFRPTGSTGYRKASGSPASWEVRLQQLRRPVTTVSVRAVAFDERTATAKVTVRKPR
jgi:DNA-binding beta-propeller fold protein YncE